LITASGHRIIRHRTIDSTNSEARRLAEQGERGPLWILADEQTAGRGRLGRDWVSTPGNFYGTFLVSISAAAAAQLGFVAALAVREVAAALKPDQAFDLKWPNDVLMGGAKFCGILSEVISASPFVVAIGCGINLANVPSGLPYDVAALGAEHAPDDVLAVLDPALVAWLAVWDEGRGFPAIRAAWERHGPPLGRQLIVDGQAGVFDGLAEDGALRLRLGNGAVKLIHAGDVRLGAMA
jgi:BirA family transcriptional regulator, biotin operon repressor / biotin---[acetyl-CoA-carboxylase] ligase